MMTHPFLLKEELQRSAVDDLINGISHKNL